MIGTRHWMESVVRRTGLGDGNGLQFTPDMTIADVWLLTATACGVTQEELADAIARSYRVTRADLDVAETTALKLVPESIARQYGVFPLKDLDRQIVVATANPLDPELDQAVGFASGRAPVLAVAPPGELQDAIAYYYSPERAAEALLSGVDGDLEDLVSVVEDGPAEEFDQAQIDAAPVVRLTNMILREAISRGASDIHLQPTPVGGIVRYRVDGVLRTGVRMPLPVLARVVSRIKVLGKLDIANTLRPQDGRTRIAVEGKEFDMRISTVPARQTEKAVVRILDSARSGVLDDTNMRAEEILRLRKVLKNREGIVAVTGPTGSGKTTTLYAALQEIASDEVNIMTVEDPVEYEISGLTQIEVNPKQGVTFANALRAILRQDPDIVFLGEIRDPETAKMAAQAAMTGHLVLTTLHTNDAVGVVRRLADLGLEAGTIVETLRGALAQRLVRRLCSDCAEDLGPDTKLDKEETRLVAEYGIRPARRATGCQRCDWSGYRGRIPVAELLVRSDDMGEAVLEDASPARLREVARETGMRTLVENGIELVLAGDTTLEELERVLGDLESDQTRDEDAEHPSEEAHVAPTIETAATEPVVPTVDAIAEHSDGQTVLVVEDDPVARAVTSALIRAEGHQVVEVENGNEALAYLAGGGDCTLVVLDLHMPGMNGDEVLRCIRSDITTAGLPVIVLTADETSASEIKLMEAGADDYLNKPVDPRRLMTRVKAVLRRAGDFAEAHPA